MPENKVVEILLSNIDPNLPTQVKVGELVIAIYKVENAYYAIDDICSHEFAFLSEGFYEEGVIECPLHQARFDVRSGAALGPPATKCLRSYQVVLDNEVLRISLPTEVIAEPTGDVR